MERNTLLAIALSAIALFSYQALFIAPKQAEALKNAQNNAVQSEIAPETTPVSALPNAASEPTKYVEKKSDYNIKTTGSNIFFANVGGSLHNVVFEGSNSFPVTDVLNINGLENVQYIGKKINNSVSLVFSDKSRQIIKTYESKDNNLIKVRLEIKNISEISILENSPITAFEIDFANLDVLQNGRENGLYEYSVYANNQIFRKDSAFKFNDKNYKHESAKVNWLGFRDRYHAFIVKPLFETKGYVIKEDSDKSLNIAINPQDKNLAPGESVSYSFDIYAGPQDPWMMKKYGDGFEKIVAFSKYLVFEWPAQAIYYTIPFLHQIFKNWGVAIILVGIIFYGLTYPLTMQSMVSMRKMQEVAPKIAALREKYKDNPEKLNAETMDIYRREKINPFGGCLPLFLQMPFFTALYQVLWRAQYLQGQGFLWIKDLTQPDRLIILPFQLPLFGNEINILPILTGCLMFMQQKISSKNMVVTDEQQVMQQKMMMYILPLMMMYMFYRFTSSWAIYFVTYYTLSTITQMRVSQAASKKLS